MRRRCVCAHCPIPLAANAGRVVTREEILDTLWGTDYVAESKVVDWQIRNLRTRLQNDGRRPRFIAPIPGHGYRFLPTFSGAAPSAISHAPELTVGPAALTGKERRREALRPRPGRDGVWHSCTRERWRARARRRRAPTLEAHR